MRRALLLCFLSVSFAAAQQVPQPGRGTVTGHVQCSDTHTPCRFASVVLEEIPARGAPVSAQAATYAAPTDLNGAYRIPNVEPGTYFVVGRAPGYLSSTDLIRDLRTGKDPDPVAQEALRRAGLEMVTVSADGVATRDLVLSRGATLGGEVRFDDGGIASNVNVEIYRQADGRWQPFSSHSGTGIVSLLGARVTDEFGRFTLSALPAGTYTLRVTLPQAIGLETGILGNNNGQGIALVQGDALAVFYGNKFRLKDAIPIKVSDGDHHEDLQIEIPTSGLHLVGGTVTRADGAGVADLNVTLEDPDDGIVLRRTTTTADGNLVFNNVPSGSYRLRVPAGGALPSGLAPVQPLQTVIEVQADRTDLNLTLQAPKGVPK